MGARLRKAALGLVLLGGVLGGMRLRAEEVEPLLQQANEAKIVIVMEHENELEH